MSNVVAFPTPKIKLDMLTDIAGREGLRMVLGEVTGILTKPCSRDELEYIESRLQYVMLEIACMRVMACL